MADRLFADIAYKHTNCYGEYICGDSFFYKRIRSENRTILVLSDGMGQGVKANVLSTLTASMAVNFAGAKDDIRKIARIMLNNLPVCSVRKISYSTFTIIDIDHRTLEVTIAEHDNPQCIVFRGEAPLPTEWECIVISENESRLQTILTTKFTLCENDRMVLVSDGVTQSGLGSDRYPFGWGHKNVTAFLEEVISVSPAITAGEIVERVSERSTANDCGKPQDDTTCAVIHLHKPRKLLLASCPPADKRLFGQLGEIISGFEGRKIVCGHPLAEIVGKEMGKDVKKDKVSQDPETPPLWHIEGIDLVTEGIITINKVFDLLNGNDDIYAGEGAAYLLCRELTGSDEIELLIGTKRGTQSSPYLTDEFELRRKTLKRIGKLLEKKYIKEVSITYI